MKEYQKDPFEVEPENLATGQLDMDGSEGEELATFGAGCYWGTEKFYVKNFQKLFPGAILGTSVGFMSPNANAIENPKYRAVCSGTTSHIEVVHMRFDNRIASFEDLVKFLFTFHDPTTKDQQEQDKGTQY